MASEDFLYSVGTNTEDADAQLKSFVERTAALLNQLPKVAISVDLRGLDQASKLLQQNSDTAQRERSAADAQNRRILELQNQIGRLRVEGVRMEADELQRVLAMEQKIADVVNGQGSVASGRRALREAQGLRTSANVVQSNQIAQDKADERELALRNKIAKTQADEAAKAQRQAASAFDVGSSAIARQKDALDGLNRILGNTVFKFIEYEVIMQGFNAVMHEIGSSLKQAGDVQFEQTLQGLYNLNSAQVNLNDSLTRSIEIAKRWGTDITDVQQVVGMWTKQTHDLSSATYLANQAEMMHRASGIDTMEVYKDSVAMATQLGITLDKLPHVYDQITEAALKMAVPMKSINGKGPEAMRDLFQGVAASAATLKSMGFADKNDAAAGSIAIVANQIQATGEHAASAAHNLTSMFAALEGAGKHRAVFESIIGKPEDIKSFDDLMGRMESKVKQLYKAYADGQLGVRPAQFESLATFEASLGKIRDIYRDIQKNSNGKLQLVAEKEMATYGALMDRVKTSVQEFSLSLGNQLLPTATNFARFLSGSLLPLLTAHTGAMVGGAKAVGLLATAFALMLAQSKVAAFLQGLATETAATTAMTAAFGAEEYRAVGAMDAAIAQMEREKVVIAELERQKELLAWITGDLAAKEAALGVEIGTVADIAGTRAVSGFVAMRGALAGMASTAVGMLGPLAAILAVMQAIDGADAKKNFDLGADLMMKPKWSDGWRETAEEHPFQILSAYAQGNGGQIESQPMQMWKSDLQQAAHGHAAAGSFASRIYNERTVELQANAKGDSHSADVARQNQAELLKQQYFEHHNGIEGNTASLTKAIEDALRKTRLGKGAEGAPASDADISKKKKRGPHVPDAEDLLRHKEEIEKRYDQGEISFHNDEATAARDKIEMLKTMDQVYGTTQGRVKELTAAYNEQISQTFMSAGAASKEADALRAMVPEAEKQVHATKAGSDAHEKALFNLSAITAAYRKAEGAAAKYRAEVLKIAEEKDKDVVQAQIAADLTSSIPQRSDGRQVINHPTDIEGYRKAGETIARGVTNSTGGLVTKIAAGEDGLVQIQAFIALLEKEKKKFTDMGESGKAALGPVNAVLSALVSALQTVNKETETAKSKLDALSKTLTDMQDTLLKTNTKDIGELLGLDPAELSYVTAVADGFKKVYDEREKLRKLQKEIGDMAASADPKTRERAQARLQEINDISKLIDENERLIPQLARLKEVRAADEYKATANVLNSYGSKALGDAVDTVFASAGKGRNASGLKAMIADWTKQVVDAYYKQMVTTLTDTLFHVNPNDAQNTFLTNLYNQHVKGIMDAANVTRDAAETMKAAADENVEAAGGTVKSRQAKSAVTISASADSTKTNPQTDPNGTATVKDQSVNQDHVDKADQSQTGQAVQNSEGHLVAISSNMATVAEILPLFLGMIGGQNGGALGGVGSLLSMASPMLGKLGLGGASSLTAGIGAAIGIGSMMGGVLNHSDGAKQSSTYGAAGALLGVGGMAAFLGGSAGMGAGMMGMLTSGPAGWALLAATALLGGAAGGIFGPHWGGPTNYPDRSNTQAYGQFVSNLNGAQGSFNGQTIGPTSQYDRSLGNEDLAQQLYGYISQASNYSNVTGAPLAAINQLKALSGGSPNGLGIAGEKNGMFTLASGQQIKVTDYQNLIAQVQAIQQNTANTAKAVAPLMSIFAVGAGPGYAANPYNTPGMNASELNALEQNKFSTYPTVATAQRTPTDPYATPGVSNAQNWGQQVAKALVNATKSTLNSQVIQIVSNLLVNSEVLASAVNSVNTAAAYANGEVNH